MTQFKGSDRFTIQRRLGSGSFGVVFEAFDQERQTKVALKVPHEASALNIFLFKQEFRALADVVHPNLVNLYELMTYGTDWFFTMELVEGRNFYEFLCPGEAVDPSEASTLAGSNPPASNPEQRSLASVYSQGMQSGTFPGGSSGRFDEPGRAPSGFPGPGPRQPAQAPADYDAVRILLRQLAEGVWTLHQHGKLHGDIKPSNVLVAQGGRVVLLDFGLAVDLGGDPASNGRIAGTPAFMAPEQIGGHAATEASDWYSVGVMLYLVLTGQLPFPGSSLSSIINKMRVDPPAPASLIGRTPEDLDSLCMDLLRRKPEQRPPGNEILARLGLHLAGVPVRQVAPARSRTSTLLIGREPELARLGEAYEASQRGGAVMAFVHGPSGLGKTYLLRRFLHDLQREEPKAVLLTGRCYEQESVPYKALDSLLDSLSQYLKNLPVAKIASLLPRNLPSLARLFPVLQQVDAIAHYEGGLAPAPDPQELRRRAFAALRELLGRIGDRYPLVLVIDDLQWGDQDSAALLSSLFQAPDPPSMLVLASYRSEEGRASAPLVRLQERLRDGGARVLELEVGPLPLVESANLARAMLGSDFPDGAAVAAGIAATAHGNPFFIGELSRHARLGLDGPHLGEAQSLEGYIRSRVAALPEPSRRLLEALALAGHPVEWEVLQDACELADAGPELLASLRSGHLIRARGTQRKLLETFHDRIRESVLQEFDPDRAQALHLRLAQALERVAHPDAQALAQHFLAAGDPVRAADYALIAADQAVMALAFERAAYLFRQVLELRRCTGAEYQDLVVKLGDALANAGLCREAAQAYLQAVPGASPYDGLRLQRRASEEWFRSGHFDQGVATLRAVLHTIGLGLTDSPLRALVSMLARRMQIRLRGYGFKEVRESRIPQADLDRIDICWAAAMGLGPIDLIRGGDFQARQLLLTLRAGEPFRVVRALAHETIYVSHRGNRSLAATHRLQAMTLSLAEKTGHPNPLSRAYIAAGTAALMQGRWKAATDLLEQAENLLRENCTGLGYELHIAQHHALLAHLVLGNLREVSVRLPNRLQAAQETGDVLAITNLRTSVAPALHLVQDDPARALRETRQAIAAWSSAGFHVQHYNALCSVVNALLYQGSMAEAWAELERQWRPLRRSMLLDVQGINITCMELKARTALALARELGEGRPEQVRLLKVAHGLIHRIEGENTRYGEALALKLQGMEAMVEGRPEEAGALYFQAEVAFQSCDMQLHAAVVRRARGRLEGPPGVYHTEAAEKWLQSQGIVDPGRYVAMHVPNMDLP